MKIIDADALISEIKKDTEKAIEQDDKVSSFWLGYVAGLVIKQPTIQSALDSENLVRTIENGITATNSRDAYSLGMRNGMRWCKSLIDGVEPKFEDDVMSVDDGKELPPAQPEPKEGYWKKDETDDCPPVFRQFRICSVCGAIETSETNYCPNCGSYNGGGRK